jgi:tetratricopeptide (TPR) repeat protein
MQNIKQRFFARFFVMAACLITVSLPVTAKAADNQDIKKLLSSKECRNCDLSNAGLVMADLSKADLSGANLAGANLSQANLQGANLTGADLTGASLYGVNLTSAKLTKANLAGADLRDCYLTDVDLSTANFKGANFQGAIGVPAKVATPEEFYAWGIAQGDKGNLGPAINYFSQAIALKPDYAGAYLSRGVAYYQSLDRENALADAVVAARYFSMQKNAKGLLTAQAFVKELTTPYTGEVKSPKPSFFDFVSGIGSLLLQFLP